MFGSESFVYNDRNDTQHPWSHVLTQHPSSLHAKGIREAWNHISTAASRLYESVDGEVINTHLLTLPASQAGFTPEGKIQKGSVTAVITKALDKARHQQMKQQSIKQRNNSTLFSPTDRMCQVMLNCDTLSSQFLTALPNASGIMPDKIIIEVFAHYMSLPSPAMKPFTTNTHYIGRDGQQIDQYGDAVAKARLCGNEVITTCNTYYQI